MLTYKAHCFTSAHARPNRTRSVAVRVVASENGTAFADGTKVKVIKSVKVYHAPKQPQGLDLEGMEGTIAKNVLNYKGKQLSANLPYQIVFQIERDGKPAKLICHLVSSMLDIAAAYARTQMLHRGFHAPTVHCIELYSKQPHPAVNSSIWP